MSYHCSMDCIACQACLLRLALLTTRPILQAVPRRSGVRHPGRIRGDHVGFEHSTSTSSPQGIRDEAVSGWGSNGVT